MSIVPEFLQKLFESNSKVLGWQWVPDDHVVDGQNRPVPVPVGFVVNDDYVVLRLAEMYLRRSRVLWKEFYPLVHAFIAYGDPAAQRNTSTVAGPGQLKDLGSSNLDRLIGLAYRLMGPLVYDGQDIELLAGLYSVPAEDGAKVLIDTLSQLSGVVPALKQVTEVANVLKSGAEGLLGLSGTGLALGIHDTLRAPGAGAGRPAKPGFVVAINAPQTEVPANTLWVKEGRLYEGPNPVASKPFDSTDMMLFELHRGPSRAASWATLPALAARAKAFDTALRDTPAEQLPVTINNLFRQFEADLRGIDDLSNPDKSAIRAMVANDLKGRVSAIQGGGLIETRSVAGSQARVDMRSFAPRTIPDLPADGTLPSRDDNVPLFG
ncbi:MAG TPA: hypothetical protein VHE81_17585 [Lacipirellulaceae bacterium]|nr:hypothetical protein [Lacipirellulaceae bacterium]HWB49051.1 hypothetical protein [Stellaceae bacterium]